MVVLEIVHAYHFNMNHSDMKLIGWLMIAYNYDDLNNLETAFGSNSLKKVMRMSSVRCRHVLHYLRISDDLD